MPDWIQWTMGIVAALTATAVAGAVSEIRSLSTRVAKLETETARLPELERLLREVRENVAAIRAHMERD